jgi:uncharacterized membrane protein YqaE (UPF0057 family)
MRSVLLYLLAFFLPPVAVYKCGTGSQVLISFLLWLLGAIPGIFYAFMVVARYNGKKVEPGLGL